MSIVQGSNNDSLEIVHAHQQYMYKREVVLQNTKSKNSLGFWNSNESLNPSLKQGSHPLKLKKIMPKNAPNKSA